MDIIISHAWTNEQLVDIITKPLDEKRFQELRSELNIIDSQNVAWKVAYLKCSLFHHVLSLYSLKIHRYVSCRFYLSNRFMLPLIFPQACPWLSKFSKSCPHGELVLNYWSWNQIIYYKVFGRNSKIENPFSTRQVRPLYRTSLVHPPG
jgi:hypothetical protein